MGLIDIILRRTPPLADAPIEVSVWERLATNRPPRPALNETVTEPVSLKLLVQTEPIFLLIDYVDSEGVSSSRRILIHGYEMRPDRCLLLAHCYERKTSRSFRADRILQAVTADGEVFTGEQLLRDLLDVDPPARGVSAPVPAGPTLRRQIDLEIRPAVTLLVAAGRIDDDYVPVEMEVIHHYIENECRHLCEAGILSTRPTIEDIGPVCRRVKTVRPTREDVLAETMKVGSWDNARIARLNKAIIAVIEADGEILFSEEMLQSEINSMINRQR
ncbi:MAG: hypothetical protein ABI459_06515 [Deltaproteobacteria bacterium]